MKKLLATLVTLVMIVTSLAVLTSCDAKDGVTPTIGENGNWFIGETDTGIPATGPKGDTGDPGATGLKGDTGVAGPTTDGAALEAPTFRYNEYKKRYEYSFDGRNWFAIEKYDPSTDFTAPLRDTTLSSYSYPIEHVTPAEGTILTKNGRYEIVGKGNYCVALIDITGCVFDKVTLVANAESGEQPNWCFLTKMPTLNQYAPFCDGYTALAAPEDETATEVTVDIPEDATVLVVYYQDYDKAPIPYCPSSITFLKDDTTDAPPSEDTEDEESAAPVIDSNLLDDTLTEYAYPMDTVLPAEGVITYYFEDGDPDQHKYMVDELHKVAFINIEGTVFDAVKFIGNDASWLGWTFLTEMPELGDVVTYAGDYDSFESSGRGPGELSNPVTIPDDAKVLVVYYQDCNADGSGLEVYVPGGILFVKDAE